MAEPSEGEIKGTAGPSGDPAPGVLIDNRTTLPDEMVREAIMAQWVENGSMQFGVPSTFQIYATNQGSSMLSRSPFRVPTDAIEEIRLARQVADSDDDISAVINQAINTAYRDGMQNQHPDQKTNDLFNQAAFNMNLDSVLKEMMREWLISSQVNTISLFSRQRLNFTPDGTDTRLNEQLAVPQVGVLPAENIRITSLDIFGSGDLAYEVHDDRLKRFLDELFDPLTTPARLAAMRQEQPVISQVFTGSIVGEYDDPDPFVATRRLYKLNPRMVHRSTMPKGASPYPRPRTTANFALLEAKRLLNILDYSLLQGGTNYIVIAKQGSDALPAKQPEIDNLTDQVRRSARTGVLVGDHRLTVEIITPDLGELLNASKRKLVGRKLAMQMLAIPEQVTDDAGGEGARQESTWIENTVTSDRHDIKRHIERFVYQEIAQRNRATFTKGAPQIWHQRIVLSGIKDFFTNVLSARDRGDIPRKYAVETLGFDYEAGVAQRKRETDEGHDEIMVPGSVPFSSPGGSGDGGQGRPPGSSSNNGRPGASSAPPDPAQRQRRAIPRQRGEAIRAVWDDALAATVRVGELTEAVLTEYPDHTIGRVTEAERRAVTASEVTRLGPVAMVPVNPDYEVTEVRAFRLEDGLSMIVGQRADGALVARALCFREPHFDIGQAEDMALRWGFLTATYQEPDLLPEPAPAPATPTVGEVIAAIVNDEAALKRVGEVLAQAFGALRADNIIVLPDDDKEIVRDETGAIVGSRRRRSQ